MNIIVLQLAVCGLGAGWKAVIAQSLIFEQSQIEGWSWWQNWPFSCYLQLFCWVEYSKTNRLVPDQHVQHEHVGNLPKWAFWVFQSQFQTRTQGYDNQFSGLALFSMANLSIREPSSASRALIFQLMVLRPRPSAHPCKWDETR